MKVHDSAIFNEVREMGLNMFSIPRPNAEHGGLDLIYDPTKLLILNWFLNHLFNVIRLLSTVNSL